MVELENIGKTAAIDVTCICRSYRWSNKAAEQLFLPFFNDGVFSDQNSTPISLLPGERYEVQVLARIDPDTAPGVPTAGIKVGYRWPDGRRARTCRAFHMHITWSEPEVNPVDGKQIWRALKQALIPVPVNVTE